MIKRYLDYLKDNPKGYWFKRKVYGWGWTPARWQGWAVLGVFVVLLLWNGLSLGDAPSRSDLMRFFVVLALLVIGVLSVCYKTGEKPKWQWGIPKETNKDSNHT